MLNKKLMLTALVLSTATLSASAKDFVAQNHSRVTELCITAVSGNRAAMFNKIKASGYSKQFIVKNIQCNGENIAQFVHKNGRNHENMLKVLNTHSADVTITDLAMNMDK